MRRLPLIMLALALCPSFLAAHETDQFTIPGDREVADVGPALSRWFYDTIERAVEKTNTQIRSAIESGDKAGAASLQTPEHLATAVNREMPWAMDVIEGWERRVSDPEFQRRYPGRVTGYKEPFENILQYNHFILDPRQFFRLFLSQTIKAYGVYMGTDKIGHFTDMGMNYYREYAKARRGGMDEEKAEAHAIEMGENGLIFSERGMLGLMTAGAYSNGDLAANYVGMLFYRNVAEKVMLKGQVRPPMVVRDGEYWRLNDHVRRDSDFFALFISDHYDEALNPSLFEAGMRDKVRRQVQVRAANVLRRYADHYGSIRPPEYFNDRVRELSTYWGRNYGHLGTLEELVAVGNTCYLPAAQAQAADPTAAASPLYKFATSGRVDAARELIARGPDLAGRTALQLAACDPDRPPLDGLLAEGANPLAADKHRVTALHAAARAGNDKALGQLLPRASTPEPRDEFNATPLHLAAGSGDAASVRLLLQRGTTANAEDDFGRRPLHEAARAGADAVVTLLLNAGADVNDTDDYGTTPLHLACRAGHPTTAKLLLDRGAKVNEASAAGATPLHEAAMDGTKDLVRLLLERGANRALRDAYGRRPADVATERGCSAAARMIGGR